MATQKPESTRPMPLQPEERYFPGDPIPAPEVAEADSESVWALFSENPKEPEDPDGDFPETQRAPL